MPTYSFVDLDDERCLPGANASALGPLRCLANQRYLRENRHVGTGVKCSATPFSTHPKAWWGFPQLVPVYRGAQTLKVQIAVEANNEDGLVRLECNGIVSSSSRPLKLAYMFALLGSVPFILFLVGNFVAWKWYGVEMVPGWSSLLLAIIAFGTLTLIMLGVIGEYIARIYEDTKQRPSFIVRENSFDTFRILREILWKQGYDYYWRAYKKDESLVFGTGGGGARRTF